MRFEQSTRALFGEALLEESLEAYDNLSPWKRFWLWLSGKDESWRIAWCRQQRSR